MNFLKTIADKAKSAADSPTRSTANKNDDGQEGFLCPICFTNFQGPDQLRVHFEVDHAAEQDTGQPHGETRTERRLNSTESDNEDCLLKNQIKALEEAKILLTSEVVSLRQQLAQTNNGMVANHIDERVLERSNQLAAENVALKAAVDDLTSHNALLESRCKVMEEDNVHRNSIDDNTVLKQELVSVQKAMDELMKGQDKELQTITGDNQRLTSENEQLLTELNSIKLQLIDCRATVNTADSAANHKQLQKANNVLNASLAEKEAELVTCNRDCDKLTGDLKELKLEHSELKQSLETCRADLANDRTKSDKLDQELAATTHQLQVVSAERTRMDAELADLRQAKANVLSQLAVADSQAVKLSAALELADKSREELEKDLARLTGEREELLKQIQEGEGVNLAIQQLTQENSGLQTKLSEQQQTLTESLAEASVERDALQKRLAVNMEDLVSQHVEVERLMTVNSRLQTDLESSETKCSHLEHQLEAKSLLEAERRQEAEQKSKELLSEKKENSAQKNVIDDLREEKTLLSNQLTEKSSQLAVLESAKANLESECQKLNLEKQDNIAVLKTCREEAERLAKKLEEESVKNHELKASAKSAKEEILFLQENVKMLKEAKSYLEQEKDKLERDVDSKMESNIELSKTLQSEKARVEELESVISATEDKVTEMRTAIEAATGKELSLLSDLEEKSKTISAIEQEKSSIVSNLQSKQTTLETLRQEKETAEHEAKMQHQERQLLEEQICTLQSKWEKERADTSQVLAELKAARALNTAQVVELREQLAADKAGFEAERQQMEQKLAARAEQISSDQTRLEALHAELSNLKHETDLAQSKASKQIVQLETSRAEGEASLASACQQIASLEQTVSTAAVERDAALSRLLELEAAVGAAGEERRGLLERCLAAEAETERLRNVTVELRRKMDDSQAALHELGRENQSLQVDLARQSGRKWRDDSDATNCQGCSAAFSLTIRKHHCRNCGSIFCNDCSSKQAMMEGFKKPQRVCDGCSSELGSK